MTDNYNTMYCTMEGCLRDSGSWEVKDELGKGVGVGGYSRQRARRKRSQGGMKGPDKCGAPEGSWNEGGTERRKRTGAKVTLGEVSVLNLKI